MTNIFSNIYFFSEQVSERLKQYKVRCDFSNAFPPSHIPALFSQTFPLFCVTSLSFPGLPLRLFYVFSRPFSFFPLFSRSFSSFLCSFLFMLLSFVYALLSLFSRSLHLKCEPFLPALFPYNALLQVGNKTILLIYQLPAGYFISFTHSVPDPTYTAFFCFIVSS